MMSMNTDALMKDLNDVLKTGIDKLVSEFSEKYILYEETHKCVLNLQTLINKSQQSVKQELQNDKFDKLERQMELLKEEVALLKITGGKPNCDLTCIKDEPVKHMYVTPLGTESAQSASSLSLITAREAGVLNVQRCII